MNIQTKYSLNQRVWKISNKRKEIKDPCKTCEGSGTVTINNTPPRTCPDCYGRTTKTRWEDTQWLVDESLVIGQVKVEITSLTSSGMFSNVGIFDPNSTVEKIEYMCYETGVGSGRIHREADLCTSKEFAEQECKKRNESAK